MENEKDGLIPGFIGEAMRSANLEHIQKEEDLGKDINPLEKNKPNNMENSEKTLEEAIAENQAIHSGSSVVVTNEMVEKLKKENESMENLNEVAAPAVVEPTTKCKVISGKNGIELEKSINLFLDETKNIDIIRTDFGTAVGGVYYTILYKTRTERV